MIRDEIMSPISLIVFFCLFSLLSACGDDAPLDTGYNKKEVTFKSVNNVVAGSVVPPSGKTLAKVELSYNGSFPGAVSAASCYMDPSGGTYGSAPKALFCQDNNFYFSEVTNNVFTVRATFSDSTFLDSLIVCIPSNSDVKITGYGEQKDATVTSLSIQNMDTLQLSWQSMFDQYSRITTPALQSYDLFQSLLHNELNSASDAESYSSYSIIFYQQLHQKARDLMDNYLKEEFRLAGCNTQECQDARAAAIAPIRELTPNISFGTADAFQLCNTDACQRAREAAQQTLQ